MLSDAEMDHLKTLARLELSDEETQQLKGDLNSLLSYFESLSALDTEGVLELARPLELSNVFREDAVKQGLGQKTDERLAVESQDGFFKVPRTVESGE